MHIYFLLYSYQKGDCGKIVYVQDSREPYNLYPLGLFTGKSLRKHKGLKHVFTAVALQPCIDDIKQSYRHLVRNLRPIEKMEDDGWDGRDMVSNLERSTVDGATGSCTEEESLVDCDTGYKTGGGSSKSHKP